MILPNVMPDEWSRSFLGRICILNGTSSPEDLKPSLLRQYSDSTGTMGEKNWTELLAAAAGLSVPSFCAHHTLLPFFRTVRPAKDCIPHGSVGDVHDGSAHGRFGHRRHHLNLCPECTTEDLGFWGFSYWRRSHQLYGSVFCQKHEVGLHQVHITGWIDLPKDALRTAKPLEADATFAALSDPVIRRYVEISLALAERTQPVSIEWMVYLLKRQLRAKESERGHPIKKLTALAKELVPTSWLDCFFPDLDVVDGETNSLDRTCSNLGIALATPFYALALALLFDDADDAIMEVSKPTIESLAKPSQLPLTAKAASSQRDKCLHAAVQAFVEGASIREASEAQGIDASELEALLRSSTAQLTALMSKRTRNKWPKSKIVS